MIKNVLRTTLLTGLAAACLAPAASADSIVFLEGGNVAVAQPDGSGKVQLTDGGDWHSPTQADDGTIAAVNGVGDIVVMAKDGRVLRTITTPKGVKASNAGSFAGEPVGLSFSPDGSKIAYSYVEALCPPAAPCGTMRSTFYTHADASPDATPVETYGNQYGVSQPEWLDNNRALVFGGALKQANVDTLDSGDYNYSLWFSKDDSGEFVSDGELSRSGDRFAAIWGYGENTQIAFWSGGPSGGEPAMACASGDNDTDENYADPSWSPDGSSVAFASSKGVEVLRFTAFGPNSCATDGSSVLIAPGASTPDWGPAEPATARFTPGQEQKSDTGNTTNNGQQQQGQQQGGPANVITPSGARKQRFRGTIKVGCTASAAGTCEAVALVRAGGTIVSKVARKQVAAGQKVTLKLRFSKPAARKLRKALKRRGKAKATITLSAPGASAKHVVTLKR
jgi:dipeptidyl aminopeptidase/acylaminoacyl peptidase